MIYNSCINKEEKQEKDTKAEQRTDTKNSKEGGTYCCMECGKRFATHGAYILHLKEEHAI